VNESLNDLDDGSLSYHSSEEELESPNPDESEGYPPAKQEEEQECIQPHLVETQIQEECVLEPDTKRIKMSDEPELMESAV
jgi:hypothetical protein